MTARTISTRDTSRGAVEREGPGGTNWLTDRWSIINVAMMVTAAATVARTQRWWHDKIFSQATFVGPFPTSIAGASFPLYDIASASPSSAESCFWLWWQSQQPRVSSRQPPATPTFVLLPYDLYAIAFCGNVSSMSPETCHMRVCVCECEWVYVRGTLGTAHKCELLSDVYALSLPLSPLAQSPCFSFLLLPFPLRFVHFIVDSIIFYSHASAIFGIFNLFRNFWTLYENKKIDKSVSVRVWRSAAGQVDESKSECLQI